MDLSAINKVAKVVEFLPTKKLTDLGIQMDHRISNLKFVQTKYGGKIVAEIDNEFAIEADEELFKNMAKSAQDGHLYMVYHGGKYNSIEFKRQ